MCCVNRLGSVPYLPTPNQQLLVLLVPGWHLCCSTIKICEQGKKCAQDVILCFGIIDTLQPYNMQKRVEHTLKSVVHDSYSVSVIHPRTYSQRFQVRDATHSNC